MYFYLNLHMFKHSQRFPLYRCIKDIKLQTSSLTLDKNSVFWGLPVKANCNLEASDDLLYFNYPDLCLSHTFL